MMDLFISIPFAPDFDAVSRAITEVAKERRLVPYRVDEVNLAEPIAQSIDRKIRESRIVIADVTGSNPNVLHELGQAQSLGKPIVIISQDDPRSAPFNIRGMRVHRYNLNNLTDTS